MFGGAPGRRELEPRNARPEDGFASAVPAAAARAGLTATAAAEPRRTRRRLRRAFPDACVRTADAGTRDCTPGLERHKPGLGAVPQHLEPVRVQAGPARG